ncbi:(-)-germacrene D synthase-like isoform X2 [Amaranthus tricolor]|nr:(-)-germacrene D synthase-like isoform X2 [Amaranthus tricolor]
MEQKIKVLKEEVQKELVIPIVNDPKERLVLIDEIQRLGVAYHFEEAIEANLQEFYKNDNVGLCYKGDLQYVSLKFRLLRQHGLCISSEIFDEFKKKDDSFIENNVEGILSLYEACQLRLDGENVLEEALLFTTTHLTFLVSSSTLSSSMAEQISRSLKRPLYKRTTPLEAKHQITIYQLHPSHNQSLLRLAKLNFNLLQSQHKMEINDIYRWTINMDYSGKFPYARERVTESFFWALGVCYEPKYAYARKLLCKFTILITAVDDIYDSYGTIHELELFTDVVHRWDSTRFNQLPDYFKFLYQFQLHTIQEFEQELTNQGKSHDLSYLKKEFENICEAYLQEARWLHEKLMPTYEEYIKVGVTTSIIPCLLMATLQGMGDIARKEDLEWIFRKSKSKKATGILCRIMNDIHGHKEERKRNHIPSAVECYMANYGVSAEDAYKELEKKVEEEWKNVRAEMIRPTVVPMPILMRILNACKTMYDLYKDGEDGFTRAEFMKSQIKALLIEPVI